MHKANLTKLAALKTQAKALESSIKALQVKIITDMESEGIESITHNGHTFTIVRGSRTSVDVSALRACVGEQMFGHLTKTVVDTTAFNNAIFTGIVSREVDALCATHKPTSPYVKVS